MLFPRLFPRLLLILILTSSLKAQLNTPCPHPPCFPSENLAMGIDLSNGEYKAFVLSMTWGQNSYYFDPFNNQYYNTPANISIKTVDTTVVLSGTLLFNNTEEIEQWQASLSVEEQDYILGMYSHTHMTYDSIDAQYTQIRNSNYVLYNYGFYEAIIPKSSQVIDPLFYEDVQMLPQEYDQVPYFECIGTYGTHFSTDTVLGLKYQFSAKTKVCMDKSKSQSYIYDQVTTDGWIHSDQHTTYSGQTTTDEYYSQRTMTAEAFFGGDIRFQNSASWDEWVDSACDMINPVPVSIKAKPIYTLIDDPQRRQNMKRALEEYFNIRKKEQDALVEQKRDQKRQVSFGIYNLKCTGLDCVPYFVQYPLNTYLSLNETMAPTGLAGSCNNLRIDSYTYTTHGGTYTDYYYCMDLYTCQRNDKNQIRAINYFDSDLWLRSSTQDQDCAKTNVSKIDYTKGLKTTFNWVKNGKTYYGSSQVKEIKTAPVPVPNSYSIESYLYNERAHQDSYASKIVSDGGYHSDQSTTGWSIYGCFGAMMCVLDCEYFTLEYDQDMGTRAVCTC